MKKNYIVPSMEISVLSPEDILSASKEEVLMDGKDLFN